LPPSVSADKLTLSFYNNDNAKRFRVIVQGFTAKGFPVYLDKIVEPPAKAF